MVLPIQQAAHRAIGQIFEDYWLTAQEKLPLLATALLFFLFFFIVGYLLRRLFRRRIAKRVEDPTIPNLTGQLLRWMMNIIGLLGALHIMGLGGMVGSVLAGAGIGAVIIGFAFKDIAENFLAGVLLAYNRPFKVGDIIQVAEFMGTVNKVTVRATHVRVNDGRDIYIPNGQILKSVLTNFTKDGLLRLSFDVGLDTGADLKRAHEIISRTLGQDEDILQDPPVAVVNMELAVNTVNLRVLFWMDMFLAKKEKPDTLGEGVKSRALMLVRDALLAEGFTLPANIVEHKMYDNAKPLKVEKSG